MAATSKFARNVTLLAIDASIMVCYLKFSTSMGKIKSLQENKSKHSEYSNRNDVFKQLYLTNDQYHSQGLHGKGQETEVLFCLMQMKRWTEGLNYELTNTWHVLVK